MISRYKRNICILAALLTGGLVLFVHADQDAKAHASREYKIKAAFLYNFLKAVEWPEETVSDANTPMTIGIIGKDPFGKTFDPIVSKSVKGNKVAIRRFDSPKQSGESNKLQIETESLKKCHLLFICSSEKETFKQIIQAIKEHPVLTVGEMSNFLEAGGIINFIPSATKGDFEVNLPASKRARLSISSKLLRIAKRVIKSKSKDLEAKD